MTTLTAREPLNIMRLRVAIMELFNGTMRLPSRVRRPLWTRPTTSASPGARRSTSPFSISTAWGIWHDRASFACSWRWRVSP